MDRFALSWTDVSFTVKRRGGEEKRILDSVTGHCAPGEMLALMGPSGCGKTTLLDILGDRVKSGEIGGKILIGQHERDATSTRKITSYVAQEDSHLTCFTVRETLNYAARLSLAAVGAAKRAARVEEVMQDMGLVVCADTRVGDALIKGISGGQKRRLSIGVELLQNSPILLLDEPTSGLDSASALSVVEHLGMVATKAGHTIIMSIHQPSSAVFGAFTSVTVLSAGKLVYFGNVGEPLLKHFDNHGHPCPEFTNPAEFFLDLVNDDFLKDGQESLVPALSMAFFVSAAGSTATKAAEALEKADPKDYTGGACAGPFTQFVVLLVRTLHMTVKNPYIYLVRIVMYTCLALMAGTMYWRVGEDSKTNGNDAMSLVPLLFYIQAFLVFMSVAILPFFLEIRNVFRRERANGQITCLPYVLANFFANLPGVLVIAIISSVVVVFFADLNGFWSFVFNLLCSLIAAESLMHFVGAAQPHYIIGMAGSAALFGMFMLCEGFMVNPADMPGVWWVVYNFCFHTYSFEWFMHNQFDGQGLVAENILKQWEIEDVKVWLDVVVILAWAVACEVGFFLVLYFFHTGRR
eukprot:TRINITY_DN50643_c0_g1_i1.p1 TRINITY_DN50643_c0_g1~~TRINITY_DN50643_c0_g1_i1.p1  ORF type:complete len:579 (-),score=85.68 TRINITY_DN50643_c0_g1_i1:18-1754(-)